MPSNPHDKQRKEAADRPIRVGVFESLPAVEHAVQRLLGAGFTKEEVSVICSDRAVESHFREFEHQQPAGTYTTGTAITGGLLGAALGGLAVVAGAAVTGGGALLATAPIAAWGGGIAGGLIGAMASRGVERELANFYDQAVTKGKILVAVDIHGHADADRLRLAERILEEAGSKARELPEG